ncbi:MAG TPA: DedA family protein [Spirochaetota bacterium]|nr:DedA family protein [Spirochaetota bacterium]
MEHFFNEMMTLLLHQGTVPLYFFLFASAILENLFPPIPGDTVTVFGAFLVGKGHLRFDLVWIVTTAGSTIGFFSLYLLAKKIEQGIVNHHLFRWISAERIERAKKAVGRFGYAAIAANRFIPGLRSVVSISAGFLRMDPVPVLFFSAISAAVWNFLWIYAGYSLGNNWHDVSTRAKDLAIRYNIGAGIIISVIILGILAFILFKKHSNRSLK